jgi:hypothetical protein
VDIVRLCKMVKSEFSETNELGSTAVVPRLHVNYLHITLLTPLGFDLIRLTYVSVGFDQKRVGVEGRNRFGRLFEDKVGNSADYSALPAHDDQVHTSLAAGWRLPPRGVR